MNTHVFLITAKTNLHVGNENGGEFTIIDKAIQRDALTAIPCINSSSLKGAINEYCTNGDSKITDTALRTKLFGSDKLSKNTDYKKGEAIFFDAKLLYLPQQDDNSLYSYATSHEIIKLMEERIRLFVPDFKYPETNKYRKKNVTFHDEDFTKLCDNDNLPIIARNCLENGLSINLWYEQILPAQTVLYTIIREEGDALKNALNGKIIQIGANATIGYGFCKFELIDDVLKEMEA